MNSESEFEWKRVLSSNWRYLFYFSFQLLYFLCTRWCIIFHELMLMRSVDVLSRSWKTNIVFRFLLFRRLCIEVAKCAFYPSSFYHNPNSCNKIRKLTIKSKHSNIFTTINFPKQQYVSKMITFCRSENIWGACWRSHEWMSTLNNGFCNH